MSTHEALDGLTRLLNGEFKGQSEFCVQTFLAAVRNQHGGLLILKAPTAKDGDRIEATYRAHSWPLFGL